MKDFKENYNLDLLEPVKWTDLIDFSDVEEEEQEYKKTGKDFSLNLKQSSFCELYVSKSEFFGNGQDSYMEAYGIKPSKNGYALSRVNASKLLTNTNILKYINYILEDGGLNDQFVDKQLLFTITQNADMPSKMRAIAEYNKLRARIIKKLDVTSGGEKIESNSITFVDFGKNKNE